MSDKILIIDDEPGIRSSLRGILEDEGFNVQAVASGEEGLALIKRENFDVILLDIWLEGLDGLEVLKKLKEEEEKAQVIMITGHGSVETAVRAIKQGAYDFLEKPLSLEKVVVTVKNALHQKKLEEENLILRSKFRNKYQKLVGESPVIKELKKKIAKAAASKASVVIYGESGTGKELVARLIHQQSSRKNKKFIHINLAAIPEHLLPRELFGYIKGAFPEATSDKKGKVLLANGGTLFLDEIGEINPLLQIKLLHLLEKGIIEPEGSLEPIPVDVRIIATSQVNLAPLVRAKRFRDDLFFKINVLPIVIPPLRERKEDIPLLIDYYLDYFSLELGKKKKTMTSAAKKAFLNYSWPGNISELINVIERFVIMVPEDEIRPEHLSLLVEPRELQLTPQNNHILSLKEAILHFEKEYIHRRLMTNGWEVKRTAQELKVTPQELKEKIRSLGIRIAD
ncbi:MAG TPA: sigma-54-dependent Fis family transcriptional regulator [Candidatus Aminicenantes bacterium]|nr:sigma-54-dependent Fis family transcriptional regulator [Candidatus Aminicenantes bacterium]